MKATSLRSHGCSVVLVGVHRAPEDHHGVPAPGSPGAASPFATIHRSRWSARLDDDALEEPAATRDGRVVDDREHAHPATVARRQEWSERQLGRRRLDAARRRDAGLVEQSAQDHRAARREVVAVVVEQRVDLVRLVGEARERLDPLRELLLGVDPVEPLASDFSARMFQVFALRPWKRTYATRCVAAATRGDDVRGARARASTDTYARPCRSRNASVSARSSSSIHERWRNSTSGTSGVEQPRTRASSAFASADFTNRGWYWSRIPRSFPESSSGSSDARNSANAVVGRLAVVPRHRRRAP